MRILDRRHGHLLLKFAPHLDCLLVGQRSRLFALTCARSQSQLRVERREEARREMLCKQWRRFERPRASPRRIATLTHGLSERSLARARGKRRHM